MLLKKATEGYLLDISTNYSEGTVKLYTLYLGILSRYFPKKDISDISPDDLSTYIVYLKNHYKPNRPNGDKSPLSPAALDNHWKCIRSFFGWCNRELKISRPDKNLRRPRFSRTVIHPFTEEEIIKIIESTKYTKEANTNGRKTFKMVRPTYLRDKLIICFLLDTGLRISELCRLNVNDVDLSSGEIVVQAFGTGKKSKGRTVFIGKTTKKILWRYLAENETDKYLDSSLFNLRPESVRSLLRRMGERQKISDVHPHRFRHTFAIQYLRNGGDVFTLQRLLGHSTLSMVNHYLVIASSDTANAHRKASPVDRWNI